MPCTLDMSTFRQLCQQLQDHLRKAVGPGMNNVVFRQAHVLGRDQVPQPTALGGVAARERYEEAMDDRLRVGLRTGPKGCVKGGLGRQGRKLGIAFLAVILVSAI